MPPQKRGRTATVLSCSSDDSLGYEFPFRVRVVRAGGAWCARCAWPRLCRGCTLPSDDTPVCVDPPGASRPPSALRPPPSADHSLLCHSTHSLH